MASSQPDETLQGEAQRSQCPDLPLRASHEEPGRMPSRLYGIYNGGHWHAPLALSELTAPVSRPLGHAAKDPRPKLLLELVHPPSIGKRWDSIAKYCCHWWGTHALQGPKPSSLCKRWRAVLGTGFSELSSPFPQLLLKKGDWTRGEGTGLPSEWRCFPYLYPPLHPQIHAEHCPPGVPA